MKSEQPMLKEWLGGLTIDFKFMAWGRKGCSTYQFKERRTKISKLLLEDSNNEIGLGHVNFEKCTWYPKKSNSVKYILLEFKIEMKMEDLPWSSDSVGGNIIPYTEMLQVWLRVRAYT